MTRRVAGCYRPGGGASRSPRPGPPQPSPYAGCSAAPTTRCSTPGSRPSSRRSREACGPAPPEACDLVRATALWWRIQLDPMNRSLDAEFQRQVTAVIAGDGGGGPSASRAAPRPGSSCGAAYGLRVQWRVLRDRAPAGGARRQADQGGPRAGARPRPDPAGRVLRHRALPLLRGSRARRSLKLVRWLLFLPGGDRAQGPAGDAAGARARRTAARRDRLPAPPDLPVVRERKIDEALALLDDLRQRYPHNPLFVQAAAEVQEVYLHDHPASLDAWRTMFNLARAAPAVAARDERGARAGRAWPRSSTRCSRPTTRSSSCAW